MRCYQVRHFFFLDCAASEKREREEAEKPKERVLVSLSNGLHVWFFLNCDHVGVWCVSVCVCVCVCVCVHVCVFLLIPNGCSLFILKKKSVACI